MASALRPDQTAMLSSEFADLHPEVIPVPGAGLPEVAAFALSFDGYANRRERHDWLNG
jgi:hypothetical protein